MILVRKKTETGWWQGEIQASGTVIILIFKQTADDTFPVLTGSQLLVYFRSKCKQKCSDENVNKYFFFRAPKAVRDKSVGFLLPMSN